MSRLIDADALIDDCQLAQKQADRHGREFANAFYSDGGEISTEWWCVEDMIENAPTVEPPQKWIPVTPDSPPLYMPVLTWDGGTRHVEQRIPYIRDEIGEKIFNDWWIDGDEKWDEWAEYQPNLRDGCAIKWMPLPEPYKERREE